MAHTINYFFTQAFDTVLSPFESISEFWGILFLSAVMALIVLVLYRYISSPKAIVDTKNKIKGNILAIRIYKDSWQVILVSFFRSMLYTGKYFLLNFGPVLLILPILFPAFSQMDVRYGLKTYDVGEEFMVKAVFSQNPQDMEITLLKNDLVEPVMNPVVINAYRDYKDEGKFNPIREVNWKLRAKAEGETVLRFEINGKTVEKTVVIGKYRGALSKEKYQSSSFWHFIDPVEPLIEGSEDVESIKLQYPMRNVTIFGYEIHWIILNLLLVVILALAFKNQFGVEF